MSAGACSARCPDHTQWQKDQLNVTYGWAGCTTACDWLHRQSRGVGILSSRDLVQPSTTAMNRPQIHADTPRDILLPVPVYSTCEPLVQPHTHTQSSACVDIKQKNTLLIAVYADSSPPSYSSREHPSPVWAPNHGDPFEFRNETWQEKEKALGYIL